MAYGHHMAQLRLYHKERSHDCAGTLQTPAMYLLSWACFHLHCPVKVPSFPQELTKQLANCSVHYLKTPKQPLRADLSAIMYKPRPDPAAGWIWDPSSPKRCIAPLGNHAPGPARVSPRTQPCEINRHLESFSVTTAHPMINELLRGKRWLSYCYIQFII